MHRSYQLLVIISILYCTSCSSLKWVDRAQDAFSKGAEIENNSFFSGEDFTYVSPTAQYTIAYNHINKALSGGNLKKDYLLGSAYTIKALCEWKLGRYDLARGSAGNAIREFDDYEKDKVFMTRDKAVMKALNGLIDIDQVSDTLYQVYNKIGDSSEEVFAFYKTFIHDQVENNNTKLESGIQIIEDTKGTVALGHEIQVYFILSQLSALKVWSDGINLLENSLDVDTQISESEKNTIQDFVGREWDTFEKNKTFYLEKLAPKLPGGVDNSIYQFWEDLM